MGFLRDAALLLLAGLVLVVIGKYFITQQQQAILAAQAPVVEVVACGILKDTNVTSNAPEWNASQRALVLSSAPLQDVIIEEPVEWTIRNDATKQGCTIRDIRINYAMELVAGSGEPTKKVKLAFSAANVMNFNEDTNTIIKLPAGASETVKVKVIYKGNQWTSGDSVMVTLTATAGSGAKSGSNTVTDYFYVKVA
ncbi:MAG: hypothetical protein DRJ64_05290 [Thermoprotei archaeon]|nr:MAG: hypothetical protein DRJ64_05290 [Thermoprotei archaeon]